MDERTKRQETSSPGFMQTLYLEEEIAFLEQGIVESKENLENLENELAQTEKKKAETEEQIKNALENAEKKKKTLLGEIIEHTKQKRELEEQCAKLSARIEQANDDLDGKSKELQDKDAAVEEADKQLEAIKSERRRMSRKGKIAFIILLVVSAAIIVFGAVYCKEQISWLRYSYQRAEERKDDALAELSALEEYAGLAMVKVNNVYNEDIYNEKTGDLESSEMRILRLDVSVHFLENGVKEAVIYVDIYRPDGSLMSEDTSPEGHTTSFSAIDLNDKTIGWGNAKESIYTGGTYWVDFVYKDEVIHSQKVIISQTEWKSILDGVTFSP